jgi:hypothetical protein
MMKDSINDSRDGTIRIDLLVVPALYELRNYPLEDLRSNLAGTLIQDLLMSEAYSSYGNYGLHWRNGLLKAWSE